MTNYSDCYEIKELNENTCASAINTCVNCGNTRCAIVCSSIDDLPSSDTLLQLCNIIGYDAGYLRNPFDDSIRVSMRGGSEICFITYNNILFYENVEFDEILVYEKDRFTQKQLEHLVLRLKKFQQGDENSVLDEFLNSFTTIKM